MIALAVLAFFICALFTNVRVYGRALVIGSLLLGVPMLLLWVAG